MKYLVDDRIFRLLIGSVICADARCHFEERRAKPCECRLARLPPEVTR